MFYFQISNDRGEVISNMMNTNNIEYVFTNESYKLTIDLSLHKDQYTSLINTIEQESVFYLFLYDSITEQTSVIENCYLNNYNTDYNYGSDIYHTSLSWVNFENKPKTNTKINWKNGF